MQIASTIRSIRQFGATLGNRDLRKLTRKHTAALAQDPTAIESLHWLAAVRFVQDDHTEARSFLDKALAAGGQHVAAPIAIYAWLEARSGKSRADAYLKAFIGARNDSIFRQIDLYVDSLYATRYVDYPLAVNIETFALCNAACTFCQYPELLRKGDKMSDSLIAKIIGDLEAMPKDLSFAVTLAGVSEPLLDKRIFDNIAALNERVPQAQIGINTNGAPLTPKTLDRLLSLRIHWLSISMNDYRKEEYESTMKISYDRSLKVLDMLERRKADGEIPFNVGLTRAGDGTIHDLKFIDWGNRNYPHLSNYFTPEFVWVGESMAASVAPNVGCTHWFDLTILSTGQIAFCCIDGHIKAPHGDVHNESLLEIYNKPSYRTLRTGKFKRPEIAECRTCTSG